MFERTLSIFGRVKYFLQLASPPAHQLTPRASMNVPIAKSSKAPLPATNESPIPAITSMSPGLSLCTLLGRTKDLQKSWRIKKHVNNFFCTKYKKLNILSYNSIQNYCKHFNFEKKYFTFEQIFLMFSCNFVF